MKCAAEEILVEEGGGQRLKGDSSLISRFVEGQLEYRLSKCHKELLCNIFRAWVKFLNENTAYCCKLNWFS